MEINYNQYLPLSEATFYVLVALDEPRHGYAIMQRVEAISDGQVVIGPGTMYGVFTTLEKQGLITKLREEERRKIYALTLLGKQVLEEQLRRLARMLKNGQRALSHIQKEKVA